MAIRSVKGRRITCFLGTRGWEVAQRGTSITAQVNRGLHLLGLLEDSLADGGALYLQADDGTLERVLLI